MEPVVPKEASDVLDIIGAITKIGAGGWPAWIATGLLSLLALFIAFKIRQFQKEAAHGETVAGHDKAQAGNLPASQTIEQSWEDGQAAIDKVKAEQDDSAKKERL
jgi:hypothetical protein